MPHIESVNAKKQMIEYEKDGDKRGEYLKAWKKDNVGKEE